MSLEPAAHAQRLSVLQAQLRGHTGGAAPLGLSKNSSNLFRHRIRSAKQRLDLSDFDHVLEVDADAGHEWVDAEGLTTYEALVDATLPHALMPAVVPQLKTITLGGAAAGVGIEATSFRHGLVHDTLLEIEVLLPGGEVVHCTPDNEHADLFFGFPNSYGTLGYALRLKARCQHVKPSVCVQHVRHVRADLFFEDLARCCAGEADFIDAVVFDAQRLVINSARFVDEAPWRSDYTLRHIYYRSLLERETDYLSTHDYLWRWDTDWFWCSKNFGAQNPLLRRLLGRGRLNSRTYTRLMRWNDRWGLTRTLARARGLYRESVIQDVDIPIAAAPEFLAFLLEVIAIVPIWVCPIRAPLATRQFTLYPLTPPSLYVNFGFWDVLQTRAAHSAGHFNRLIERKVIELGGIKSLYSEAYFTPDEFERAYAIDRYRALKARYDPQRRALDLYDKCVGRA
jgi:FAD/FMN-containing dehydrogenase